MSLYEIELKYNLARRAIYGEQPQPSDFGLPSNVESTLEEKRWEFDKSRKVGYREAHKKCWLITLGCVFAAFALLCGCGVLFWGDSISFIAGVGWCLLGTFATVGFWIGLDWLECDWDKEWNRNHSFEESDYYKRYQRYKETVAAYQWKKDSQAKSFWIDLDGHQFEQKVAKLYQQYGYKTTVSKAGGDGGIDIVLVKGAERIAVQCKHHSKPVSPAVIRDLYGTMQANGYAKGILVSLNGFTSGTIDFANGKPIELVELDDLIQMANDIQKP